MKEITQDDHGSNERPRVVYVWNYVGWGGAQIYFFGLMKEARKNYRVSALLPENSEQRIFDYLDSIDIEYRLLPKRRELPTPTSILNKIKAHVYWMQDENTLVRTIMRQEDLRNTVLHVDLGFWRSFCPLFRLSLKTNVFVTIHTALPEVSAWRNYVWKLKGAILGRVGNFTLLASNQDSRQSIIRYFPPKRAASIKVAYSGFDADEVGSILSVGSDRAFLCDKFKLPANRTLIFTVGQFIERKGCWVVLEALKSLREQEIFFVWLGTSAPDQETSERISSYHLTNTFRLMTASEIGKGREDLLGLLNIADLFILASLEEGLPIALVEAMALGKPCIATRINAIPEAVDHEVDGLLIRPGDADELARAISRMLEEPEMREQFGNGARKKAVAHFDSRVGAEITAACYAEALSQ